MLRRGESRKQSFRAPVDPSVSAIFADVSIRSHRSGGALPESALEQLPATSAALPAGRNQVKTRQTRPRCSMRCMEWLIALACVGLIVILWWHTSVDEHI